MKGQEMFYDIELMTSPQVAAVAQQDRCIGLVATGATEQHGPHLPVSTDTVVARAIQKGIAEALTVPVLVTPVIDVAISGAHHRFAGTISVSDDVYEAIVTAHLEGLRASGVRRLAVIDYNGPNLGPTAAAIARFGSRYPDTLVISQPDLGRLLAAMALPLGSAADPDHAGILETSLALAVYPDGRVAPFDNIEGFTDFEREGWWDTMITEGTDALTENGVIGIPRGATASLGSAILQSIVSDYASLVQTSLVDPELSTGIEAR